MFRGQTDDDESIGPELSGWGSLAWTRAQIRTQGPTRRTARTPSIPSAKGTCRASTTSSKPTISPCWRVGSARRPAAVSKRETDAGWRDGSRHPGCPTRPPPRQRRWPRRLLCAFALCPRPRSLPQAPQAKRPPRLSGGGLFARRCVATERVRYFFFFFAAVAPLPPGIPGRVPGSSGCST